MGYGGGGQTEDAVAHGFEGPNHALLSYVYGGVWCADPPLRDMMDPKLADLFEGIFERFQAHKKTVGPWYIVIQNPWEMKRIVS